MDNPTGGRPSMCLLAKLDIRSGNVPKRSAASLAAEPVSPGSQTAMSDVVQSSWSVDVVLGAELC